MKYKILAGLIASCVATGAYAQTSVTLYGVIDISMNYTTNQDAAGNHVFSLGDSNSSAGAGDGGEGALS
ncbi:MAG: porin, partial [Burkholderiaceae bacterium]|nr:porin [Burkholderiaceae bacterium]